VEKGLYKEYKKLHYNLSKEEGLLPIVWDKFKEFMLAKYKYFEQLVSVCYKNQRLSFSVTRLSETFTAVETRHYKVSSQRSLSIYLALTLLVRNTARMARKPETIRIAISRAACP